MRQRFVRRSQQQDKTGEAGIEMTHVPYRGAGPAMNDLIPGRVDAMFSNLPGVLPQVQSGTIRGLAITTAKRSPAAPDIPANRRNTGRI